MVIRAREKALRRQGKKVGRTGPLSWLRKSSSAVVSLQSIADHQLSAQPATGDCKLLTRLVFWAWLAVLDSNLRSCFEGAQ